MKELPQGHRMEIGWNKCSLAPECHEMCKNCDADSKEWRTAKLGVVQPCRHVKIMCKARSHSVNSALASGRAHVDQRPA